MENSSTATEQRPVWFVGATFGGRDDQTSRFLRDGVWENGYTDRYIDDVTSIMVGDKIAIKATYTQKHGLPFDNRGHSVSVMKIEAVGEVAANEGDGRHLNVAWTELDPPREWFFYTHRRTVWRVQQGSGAQPYAADSLIRFAFTDEDQDVDRFRNLPFWRERFGDTNAGDQRFGWTIFYSEIADKLTQYRNGRSRLIAALVKIADRVRKPLFIDKYGNGKEGPLLDVCPFTTIGSFNADRRDVDSRQTIVNELSAFLEVQEPIPTLSGQNGIPLLDFSYPGSWFFECEEKRGPDDIEKLWQVFGDSIEFADIDDEGRRDALERSYNEALSVKRVSVRKLTMGLSWIRPWSFPVLYKNSITYIRDVLGENIPGKYEPNGAEYLELRDRLLDRFHDPNCRVHSFPELSLAAYALADGSDSTGRATGGNGTDDIAAGAGGSEVSVEGVGAVPAYSINEILSDGCFLPRERLEVALRRVQQRKSLILQGPPGTGKTWLAKRLAYALIGRKDDRLVKRFQFHPNLSYEDFVRGHRPTAGKLDLVDGPFLQVALAARNDLDNKYVVVIEEINRGNPAQIFGEMLTLLESDKRNEDEGMALAIPRAANERVHIPPNVYVIGTMNVADRSLALVDLALRRRFTFVDLEPTFGDPWRRWMHEQGGVDDNHLRRIEQRVTTLNEAIASDQSLGKQFRVGHSYVTTPPGTRIDDPVSWFREVVETEIAPLLREYWFDQTKTAEDQERKLLADF